MSSANLSDMRVFEYRRKGIRFAQIWFNPHADFQHYRSMHADVFEFQASHTDLDMDLTPFKYGVISFDPGIEGVYDKLDKGFKYEMRRAERENIVCRERTGLSRLELQRIFRAYQLFSREKGISTIPFEFLLYYLNGGALKVSEAVMGEVILQYHIYLKTKEEIILLASFPSDRADEFKKGMIGYANRSLHWYDIQHAFSSGCQRYNLGGIGNFANAAENGIVKFKKEMSPETITYYQGVVAGSLAGRVYLKVKTLLGKYV